MVERNDYEQAIGNTSDTEGRYEPIELNCANLDFKNSIAEDVPSGWIGFFAVNAPESSSFHPSMFDVVEGVFQAHLPAITFTVSRIMVVCSIDIDDPDVASLEADKLGDTLLVNLGIGRWAMDEPELHRFRPLHEYLTPDAEIFRIEPR